MIIGIGCDVVEISRIAKLIEKDTAVNRIFTPKEKELYIKQPQKAQWAAGRFAAKEAASKALKAGIARCPLNCVEILYDENGAPTVTFLGAAKELLSGINYTAHVTISHDAGIAQAYVVVEEAEAMPYIRDEKSAAMIANLLPDRAPDTHKGDMGRVAVFAGSKKYSGAGYICTLGALKAGAGLVTWCRNYEPYEIPPEAMSLMLTEDMPIKAFMEFCRDMDAVAIGPGLGVDVAKTALDDILGNISCTVVYDADALNAMADMNKLPKLDKNTVITPHVGEAARLLKKESEYVASHTLECAKELSTITGAVTVLKFHNTVVCSPSGKIFINTTGNAGMATGGSGDVLTGIIAALAKRLSPYDAARYGVYLHGLAGDFAALEQGENSMTATDIANNISKAFKMLEKYKNG